MISKVIRKIRSLIAPKSPLKREIYYLKLSIKKINREIDYSYGLSYGLCCHYFVNLSLYDLEDKMDRQIGQLKRLENKIAKDEKESNE